MIFTLRSGPKTRPACALLMGIVFLILTLWGSFLYADSIIANQESTKKSGAASKGPSGQAAEADQAPPEPSSIPLKLWGVVVSARPSSSSCVLSRSPQERSAWVFQAGDNAFQLARVVSIDAEGITIENLAVNRNERINLQGQKTASLSPARPKEPAPQQAPSPENREIFIAKKAIEEYSRNLTDILNSASAQPYLVRKDNSLTLEGFQIDNIQPGSAIAGLGIKNGDIIVEANGLKLDSLDKVMRLYQQWPKLTEVALTVIRNGQPVQIRYKIQ